MATVEEMPATPTPLAEWLRDLNDDALVALLRTRPDLAVPAPADSTVLATRAGLPASVVRACENLDRFTLAVLTALVVAAADHTPVSRPALARLLGPGVAARQLSAALETLRRHALAWGDDGTLAVVPAAREITGPHPGGLGRPAPELDGADIEALLAELSQPERKVLHTLAEGPPVGATREAAQITSLDRARTPVARLLARGLLRRIDSGTVELPAQVGIALRGDWPLGRLEPTEPKLDGRPLDPSMVDSTAAGAVLELLRRVENLLAEWSRESPAVLRSGGLGVRDVRRTARVLAVEEPTVVLLAEVGVAAGLLTNTEDQLWLPTVVADSWLAAPPERRWTVLADAWLTLARLPGLAGARDDKGRTLASLSEELRRPRAAAQRRWILEALAELPAGQAITRPEELATVLAWRAPRRGGRLRDEVVGWTVEEATALGIVALGAVSTAGRVLLSQGTIPAATALRAALPEPVDHVLVQADRTIVAPGPLEPELARQIGLVADVESAGGATVYRVSEATVRRALDAGRSAADLHELFRARSRTPVPQSLSYLIDDVARRHGQLRGGACASFLRCDDEALLAELLAHPIAVRVALRGLVRTVAISPLPLTELLGELRSAGFSPVAENADGQLIDLRAGARRAPVRPRATRPPVLPQALSAEQLVTLVRGVRAGDAAAMAD
ncbi:MAG: helicase-associated domain-containing protein [Pseudonocardiaceae bacterium]